MSFINIDSTALFGDETALKSILNDAPDGAIRFSPDLADQVAEQGFLEVLKILFNVVEYQYETPCRPTPEGILTAGIEGHLHVVKWAVESHNIYPEKDVILGAAVHRREEVLKYLLDPENEIFNDPDIQKAVDFAIMYGDWPTANYITQIMADFA